MNCTMCGAIIPTGQTNCPMCGAPVPAEQPETNQQPVQPGQPQMGYQAGPQPGQPQMGYQTNPQPGGFYQPGGTGAGINGYFTSLTTNPMNIVKLAGAVLLFIAAFLPWFKASVWGYTESWNLFKAGGFHVVTAIFLILISLVLIAWEIADYIPQIASVKQELKKVPYVDLIFIGVAFVLVIVATARGAYVHDDGVTMNFKDYGVHVSRIVGCIFAYIAVIAAAVPRVLDLAGIQIGRK